MYVGQFRVGCLGARRHCYRSMHTAAWAAMGVAGEGTRRACRQGSHRGWNANISRLARSPSLLWPPALRPPVSLSFVQVLSFNTRPLATYTRSRCAHKRLIQPRPSQCPAHPACSSTPRIFARAGFLPVRLESRVHQKRRDSLARLTAWMYSALACAISSSNACSRSTWVISGDAIHADATQTHLLLLRVGLRQRLNQILHLLRLHNQVRHKLLLVC